MTDVAEKNMHQEYINFAHDYEEKKRLQDLKKDAEMIKQWKKDEEDRKRKATEDAKVQMAKAEADEKEKKEDRNSLAAAIADQVAKMAKLSLS